MKLRKIICLFSVSAFIVLTFSVLMLTKDKRVDYSDLFGNEKGCAVIYDEKCDKYKIYNESVATEQVSPCSTFKIILTLAGLKHGVLEDEKTKFEYDGTERWLPQWNQDLTLEQAFKYSAVWCFEKIYNELGNEKVTESVKYLSYGNCDTTGEGKFWIGSTLKISPKEQIHVLKKIFNSENNFKKEHIEILKKIMFFEDFNGGKLYGKTGANEEETIGWYVGFFEKENNKTYFAVRLCEGENVTGARAKEISKKIVQGGK